MVLPRKIQLLYFHPNPRHSRANARLLTAAQGVEGLRIRMLYDCYAEGVIDVEKEKRELLAADVILFQHPLYWYSCPPLMKQWIDEVLEFGFAYGTGGTHLQNKIWIQAVTSGGKAESYGRQGSQRFTMDELFRPFEQTAQLCGFAYMKPFMVYDSGTMSDGDLDAEARRYQQFILSLQNQPTLSFQDTSVNS